MEKKKVYVETSVVSVLTARLLEATAVPKKSFDDAVHVATAAIHKMDYLVT